MQDKVEECSKLYGNKDKWIVSIVLGLLFVLLSLPFLYNITNRFTNSFGTPSYMGIIIHGIIFVLIVRLLLSDSF